MRHKIKGTNTKIKTRKHLQNKSRFVPPVNLEEFLALSTRDQELWADIGQIVTDVREGKSLATASRDVGRNSQKVKRLAVKALRKLKNGRWGAKKTDRLLRVLQKITPQGRQQVGIRDSRQASILGKYWNAVERYRDTGDASGLREFKGKHVIDADGMRVPLLTDLRELDRQGSAGNLSFETLYARVA
jgi:hypothetical protein